LTFAFRCCESVKQLEQKLKERFAASGFGFSITQAAEPHETPEDSEFVADSASRL